MSKTYNIQPDQNFIQEKCWMSHINITAWPKFARDDRMTHNWPLELAKKSNDATQDARGVW